MILFNHYISFTHCYLKYQKTHLVVRNNQFIHSAILSPNTFIEPCQSYIYVYIYIYVFFFMLHL